MIKLRDVWAVSLDWSFLDRVPHSAFAKGPVPDSAFFFKEKINPCLLILLHV
jgi:hypothetical protein